MLSNMMNTMLTKKTKEAYKKGLLLQASFCGVIGALMIALSLYLKVNSFKSGFFMGVAIATFAMAIKYFATVNNDKALTKAYIEAYDERNLKIKGLVSQMILLLVLFVLITLVLLTVFGNLKFDFILSLVSILGIIVFGLPLLTAIVNRWL